MKLRSEMREEVLDILAHKTGVNTREQGSIAVTIVDALLDEIMLLYRELERIQKQAYLSTSNGAYTELIADLVDAHKVDNETDSAFKQRASNQVYTQARGNLVAIQNIIWNTPGVATFDIERYGKGTGSFVVTVYPQEKANQAMILDNVRRNIATTVSEGIYFEVKAPTEHRIDLAVIVQFQEGLPVMQKTNLRNQIRGTVVQYINNLRKSETLVLNELIERMMSVSTSVIDLSITDMKLDGIKKSVSNTFAEDDALFVSGDITII